MLERVMTARHGSSPLARGLLVCHEERGRRDRIIPARAGFTRLPPPWRSSPRDHPRSRGVYATGKPVMLYASGSSPLARGLQTLAKMADDGDGIIPARAGFTAADGVLHARRQDHPRSRGVYTFNAYVNDAIGGSSPLARGLLATPNSPITVRKDHPRSRGVYLPPCGRRPDEHGSSPLARGLLQPRRGRCARPVDHPRSRGVY